ncbi:PepSY domain-containing protein [Actinomadura sp. HBU206391]|uniref:PepSY domain-containing protein n=1 Tax=Actinomadura sp. HBU206391 TaxID=2731692 RepID=UPI001650CC95|nr:PepSY domain-containing protein [Actinomadura sp. HBU206391]MBC6461233.1 PepSY domain-containing protein [Actinomadura sp. HBU206391]
MRRTTVIAGVAGAAIVLGGGIALAFDGGSTPPVAGRTAVTSPASPEVESGAPSDDPSATASPPESSSPSAPSESPSASAPAAPTAISRAEAERIALRTVAGGRVESVEHETEHGVPVWDIDVIAGGAEHDVEIDGRTGKVLQHETDHDDDKGHNGKNHDDDEDED